MAEVVVNPAGGVAAGSGIPGMALNHPQQQLQQSTQYRHPHEHPAKAGAAEVLVQHLLSLPVAQRREVLTIPIQQVVSDVESISGCPRCQFTRLVLAQFVHSQVVQQAGKHTGVGSGDQQLHLPPEQLLNILAPRRVANLLQFAWPLAQLAVPSSSLPATPPNTADSTPRRVSGGNNAASAGVAQPCSTSPPVSAAAAPVGAESLAGGMPGGLGPGTVTLSDSLLGDDRLLRQFLLQGLAGLQQVSCMGGACVGHRDCPGPGDLWAVEEKLQRQHDALLEQLQALGVIPEHPGSEAEAEATAAAASAAAAAHGLLSASTTEAHQPAAAHQVQQQGSSVSAPIMQPLAGVSPARKYRRGPLVPGPLQPMQVPPVTPLQSDVHLGDLQRDQQQQQQSASVQQQGEIPMDPQALGHLSEPLRQQAIAAYKELRQVLQRMARMSRARQHGLEAGASRLLNLLLLRCWRQLAHHAATCQAETGVQQLLLGCDMEAPWPQAQATGWLVTTAYSDGRQGWEGGDDDEDDVSDDGDQGTDVDTWQAGRRPGRVRTMRPGIEAMYGTGRSTASREAQTESAFSLGCETPLAGCCSHQCELERQAMRIQLTHLSSQLEECQASQESMTQELASALDQAEASHAEAMEVGRVAATRVAELESQVVELRGEQLQLLYLKGLEPELRQLTALQEEVEELRALRPQAAQVEALQEELALLKGDPGALRMCRVEQLQELVAQLEVALGAARAAQLQAASDLELQCPVCWEERKGCVFQCGGCGGGQIKVCSRLGPCRDDFGVRLYTLCNAGHQSCRTCAEKLVACPICRQLITLRIRTFS